MQIVKIVYARQILAIACGNCGKSFVGVIITFNKGGVTGAKMETTDVHGPVN